MSTDRPSPDTSRLNRRSLIVATGASIAGSATANATLAQPASPAASPSALDPAAFRALCVLVTGSDDLDEAGLAQLQTLFEAEADWLESLHELTATTGAPLDLGEIKYPALAVINNILQFWYLGQFKNQPLPDRGERIGHLVTYQTLPYVTTPAVCKAFGYWAEDPGLA